MTLAEFRALDVPALWAALPAERQAEIGAAALAVQFAGLVAGDDGSELARTAEAAFPGVQWWAP